MWWVYGTSIACHSTNTSSGTYVRLYRRSHNPEPPRCRYSGHPALVRGQRAGLHAPPRCSGGPGAGARCILPQGRLKVWEGGTFQGGLFLYAYLGFNLFHQLPIEPAISRSAHDVPHSSRRYMAQRRQTFGHIQDPTKKYTLTTNQEVALYAI